MTSQGSCGKPCSRRHFLEMLGRGSGVVLAGPLAAGLARPAHAAGTTVFDPLVNPTLQGFTEHTLATGGPYWGFDTALGLFQISDPFTDFLYYSKPFAAGEISLSCYVQALTGAYSVGQIGVMFELDAGLGTSGPFAGALKLWCANSADATGAVVRTLSIEDPAGQLSHSILFDWRTGGAFTFGRSADGNAFMTLPGGPSLSVPAAQLAGPMRAEPTLNFGCPVTATAVLAKFGAIESASGAGPSVPLLSAPLLPTAVAAAGYMALRRRRARTPLQPDADWK